MVVTHHAPSTAVMGAQHDGHLAAAYANEWAGLFEKVDLWIFGHTHHAVDEVFLGCRLISNPRGYPTEATGFQSDLEVDL